MDCTDTMRVDSKSNEQLLRLHTEELAKVRKLRLVIKEMKQIDCNKLKLPDKEHAKKAVVLLKISEYLYLSDKRDQVLNLGEATLFNFNYTERKALRELLTDNLRKELHNINSFSLKLRTELPEVFSANDSPHTKILLLEKQRRANLENLIQLRNRKCNFLKVVAELKMGPYLACELEIMLAKANLNQTKIKLLRGYFINEMLTRTERNLNAIREVEGYINNAIEENEEVNN